MNPYARNYYQSVSVHGGVANADPHTMVQMLMDGAVERMSIAKGCIERGERKRQAALLHSCVLIIVELRGCLNLAEGGPLAQNLSDLYEYMIRRLTLANSMGDAAIVLEVSRLLEEIRSAWIAIGPEVRKSARLPTPAPVNVAVGGRHASV